MKDIRRRVIAIAFGATIGLARAAHATEDLITVPIPEPQLVGLVGLLAVWLAFAVARDDD